MIGFTPMRLVCRDCYETYWFGRVLSGLELAEVWRAHQWTHADYVIEIDHETYNIRRTGDAT